MNLRLIVLITYIGLSAVAFAAWLACKRQDRRRANDRARVVLRSQAPIVTDNSVLTEAENTIARAITNDLEVP